MNREIHVPLRESPEVKSLWATRPATTPFPRGSARVTNDSGVVRLARA